MVLGKILASFLVALAVVFPIISGHPLKNSQDQSTSPQSTESPQTPETETNQQVREKRSPKEEQPWWHLPCGHRHDHERHAKSKECIERRVTHKRHFRPLFAQFRNFRTYYLKQRNDTEKLYTDRKCFQLKKKEYDYDWLPQKPNVKDFKNDTPQALIQFHEEVQIFAVALHQLKKTMDPETFQEIEEIEKRNKMITEMSIQMKAVMCELETLINHTCKHFEVKRIPINYLEQFSDKWIPSTDLTKMCIQDRGVLLAYHNFLHGWKQVFRYIKMRQNEEHHHKKSNLSDSSSGEEWNSISKDNKS